MPEKMVCFADRRSGGNILTIRVMHILDPLFSIDGDLISLQPLLAN